MMLSIRAPEGGTLVGQVSQESGYDLAILDRKNSAILNQSTVAIPDGSKLPAAFGHCATTASLMHLVAPTARIMPLKAFEADGSADLSDIIRAICYSVDMVSFSMTTPPSCTPRSSMPGSTRSSASRRPATTARRCA